MRPIPAVALAVVLLVALLAGCATGPDDAGHDHHGGSSTDPGTGLDHHGRPVGSQKDPIIRTASQNGVDIDFTVEAFAGPGGRNGSFTPDLVEGDPATVTFRLTDAATGKPLRGAAPASWIDLVSSGSETECPTRVQQYISRDPVERPEVDLNGYFLLSLNLEPSISVIDPSVRLGGLTQLYTLVSLPGPGLDWAQLPARERLVVTVPSTKQAVVVDTSSFEVTDRIDVGGEPARVTPAPGGERVWVGVDGGRGEWSGVVVIDPVASRIVGRLETGPGHHEIAFAPGGERAYVTNSAGGTVSIVDVAGLSELSEVPVGEQPVALDVVRSTGVVAVASRGAGTISFIDPGSESVRVSAPGGRGLSDLRVTPNGRLVLATASADDRLTAVDPDSGDVVATVDIPGSPDQIGFDERSAYVRRATSKAVTRIRLAQFAGRGAVAAESLPVGRRAPRLASLGPGAGFITSDPRSDAVILANPGEDRLFYYRTGAAVPEGTFTAEQIGPRAVDVLDRALREISPGVYSGRFRVPGAGPYEAALFMDSPRVAQCFSFDALVDPEAHQAAAPKIALVGRPRAAAGRPVRLRFRISDAARRRPLTDLTGVEVVVSSTAGWSERASATHMGRGVYGVRVLPPHAGLYEATFDLPSIGLAADRLPRVSLTVD